MTLSARVAQALRSNAFDTGAEGSPSVTLIARVAQLVRAWCLYIKKCILYCISVLSYAKAVGSIPTSSILFIVVSTLKRLQLQLSS